MRTVLIVWLIGAGAGFAATAGRAAGPILFNRDIRPVLSDRCFKCHGPDASAAAGGVRLDLRERATQKSESDRIPIVPGDPAGSELLRRITSHDPAVRMPPPETGPALTPEQVEQFRQWIAEGAAYQGHWAFTRVERPAVPVIDPAADVLRVHRARVRNPIDAFLGERLQREGLAFSPQAETATLLRRVALDLTGLPPTPAEVDAFYIELGVPPGEESAVDADRFDSAYERFVDRLLASPHYGERMAVQWLDFARYADSHGFQTDSSRDMSPWRDWVIRAYNENQPFDQFTVEQLAGDLLPNPSRSQLVATGFHRNHRLNGEGGIIADEWRIENVIDRVETTGLTWLGLTLNCCRCHDHKFDPITQREFYQLFAFFNNINESGVITGVPNRSGGNAPPVIDLPTPEQESRIADLKTRIKAARARVRELEPRIDALAATWEANFRQELAQRQPAWRELDPTEVRSTGGAVLTRQADGSWLASGPNPAHDTYEIVAPLPPGRLTGLLLETFPDDSLPEKSVGRYPNGNYVLSDIQLEVRDTARESTWSGRFARVSADYSQKGWEIGLLLDGNPRNGWAVDGPTRKERNRAVFVLAEPRDVTAGETVRIQLIHGALDRHNIGRFRLSTTGLEPALITPAGDGGPPAAIVEILALPAESRTAEQRQQLTRYLREETANPLRTADQQLAKLQAELTELEKTIPTAMVMQELPQPRETRLLIRGEYDRPGDVVTAALPAIFPPLPEGQPLNRLGLAAWIVSREHPLTSRVWVNRAWERFFGTGLVRTSENLGSQAEYPSHPQLLDWLAAEFMEPTVLPQVQGQPPHPWDVKGLQKLIVLSSAYRQSAAMTPTLLERDPENRLLARGPRFRLDAEQLRDQALAVSGLLTPTIGGASVRPYMPAGVWDETSRYGDLRNYKPGEGPDLYRRTLYTIWKRTAAPPSMLLFDAPTREICTVKRSRTNTPLQALSLLNETTYVEAARALAARMLTAGGTTPADRLTYGFRLALVRRPTEAELRLLLRGLEADVAHFRRQPEAAQALLAVGRAPVPEGVDPVDLAAYALTANVLLNLDEFVTRE